MEKDGIEAEPRQMRVNNPKWEEASAKEAKIAEQVDKLREKEAAEENADKKADLRAQRLAAEKELKAASTERRKYPKTVVVNEMTYSEWVEWKKSLANSEESGKLKIELQFFAKMPEEKFTQYALNPMKDANKAKTFREALGYTLENYSDLMHNIESNLDESKFVEKGDSGHGMRYEYIMELTGPNGKNANVLTAWIQEGDEKRMTSVYITKRSVTK